MRVLHVVPSYLPATRYGGPIYSVHALCKTLALRGHEVHVFTTNVDGAGISPVPIGVPVNLDGVNVWYFPTSYGRRLYRSPAMEQALKAQVAEFSILHLHSVFLWPTYAAASAARKARVPYVLAPRGMLVADLIRRKSRLAKSLWIHAIERRNIAGAAALHVTSKIEENELSALGLSPKRVAVIPNGVDFPTGITNIANGAFPSTSGEPIILCLGRISWKKGLDRLIRAMRYVSGAQLVVAGNDDEGLRPRLESIAMDSGVDRRVWFVGPLLGGAKWQAFAQAQLFVLPSYSENFGIAVLEAMACGVPVIVTPEVGLAEVVAEADAGLVVDGDPKTLGLAITRLLADKTERRRMGEMGRKIAGERFSWEAIGAQTELLYDEVLRVAEHSNTRMLPRHCPRE